MITLFTEVVAVCAMVLLPLMLFGGRGSRRGRGGGRGGGIRIGPSAPGILLLVVIRSGGAIILFLATAVFVTAVIIMGRS